MFEIHGLKIVLRKLENISILDLAVISFYKVLTLVTFGWSSLCHTATSWRKEVRRFAVSAAVARPSSPQSNTFTERFKKTFKLNKIYEINLEKSRWLSCRLPYLKVLSQFIVCRGMKHTYRGVYAFKSRIHNNRLFDKSLLIFWARNIRVKEIGKKLLHNYLILRVHVKLPKYPDF